MPKENWQQRVEDLESLPDEAIWFAIRYLDPELKQQKTPETTALVALISVIILVCAILFSLHLRGL